MRSKGRLRRKKAEGKTSAEPLTGAEQVALVRKKLRHLTFEGNARYWLNTGSSRLNRVLGSEERGLAYGKMYEFSGYESHGKTLLATFLAGLAQQEGADVAWIDFEGSWDERWAKVQGLNPSKVAVFEPEVIMDGNEGRMQSAEEVCDEGEAWIKLRHGIAPEGRRFVVLDSVANMVTEDEGEAGITGQNMRTNSSLSMFLSKLLRRWAGLARTHNTIIILINQIRLKPGVMFGSPEYTPGGRALKHNCSVRVRVRRVGNGKMLQEGRTIGLVGSVTNEKNKAGEGSVEGHKTGFKAYFHEYKWKFMNAEKLKKEKRAEKRAEKGE